MSRQRKNLIILMVGSFLTAMSFSLVVPFLPNYLRLLGVRTQVESWSGALFAVSFLASSIMSPIWGTLADRYGRKPMIIRSGLSIGAAYLVTAMLQTPGQLFAVRLANGALAGFIPAAIALVATSTPQARLGMDLGMLQTAIASGSILGPIFGGALSTAFGLRAAFVVAGVAILLGTAVVIFGVREEFQPVRDRRPNPLADLRLAWANRRLRALLIAATAAQAAVFGIQPLITLFVEDLLGQAINTEFLAGTIFSLVGVATILTATWWGKLGSRRGYEWTLVLGLAGGGLLFLPQAFVQTPLQFGVARFAFGVFIAALSPSLNSLVATAVPDEFRGRAFGILTSANQIGAVFGPLVSGALSGWLGTRPVFALTGAALLWAGLWIRAALQPGASLVSPRPQASPRA